jgi:hypothetical protein
LKAAIFYHESSAHERQAAQADDRTRTVRAEHFTPIAQEGFPRFSKRSARESEMGNLIASPLHLEQGTMKLISPEPFEATFSRDRHLLQR